jgi:hypothetical protein
MEANCMNKTNTIITRLNSARAAGRGAKERRNPPVQPRFGGQDLRVFLKSARAGGRGAKERRNPPVQPRFGGQDLRVFLNNARAAGRGAKKRGNPPVQPRFGGQDLRLFLKSRFAILAIMVIALIPAIASAHGGEEHVVGTITKVSDSAVTVKTTAGKTEHVGLDAKTICTRGDQSIQKTDIHVGDRVVIHAEEVNEKLVAHTVEIGAAAAASKTK